jgi:hypothetical protein
MLPNLRSNEGFLTCSGRIEQSATEFITNSSRYQIPSSALTSLAGTAMDSPPYPLDPDFTIATLDPPII